MAARSAPGLHRRSKEIQHRVEPHPICLGSNRRATSKSMVQPLRINYCFRNLLPNTTKLWIVVLRWHFPTSLARFPPRANAVLRDSTLILQSSVLRCCVVFARETRASRPGLPPRSVVNKEYSSSRHQQARASLEILQ